MNADHFENPILRGVNPDPSICRVRDDFYLITSSMFFYPGIPVYHSRDLVNWRLLGHALTRAEQFHLQLNHGNPMIYAATLRHHGDTFYIITTDVHGGGNFYVTAKDPAGPWSAPVLVDRAMFDPSLFFDDDGKVYYTRRGDLADKDIVQAEIDLTSGRLLTPLRSISKGLVSDDTEGPHLYKINGWYYLTMGEGGSRALHMQTIARSRSPYGPFDPCPHNPFLSQHHAWWHPIRAVGHADFVQSADGRWWTVFLGTRHASYDGHSTIGRETFLAPLSWIDGWPVVEATHTRQFTVQVPTLPLHPWAAGPARDDFDSVDLDPAYVQLSCPQEPRHSLTERPGFLRLRGQAATLGAARPVAFVGRRQEDMRGSFSIRIEFSSTSAKEESGLTVFQGAQFHYDLALTTRGGRPVVVLRKTVGDLVVEAATREVMSTSLWLKVEMTPDRYTFSFAEVEHEWRESGTALPNLIATEVAGVWSGALLGAYSTGHGQACVHPADIDWFEYKALH